MGMYKSEVSGEVMVRMNNSYFWTGVGHEELCYDSGEMGYSTMNVLYVASGFNQGKSNDGFSLSLSAVCHCKPLLPESPRKHNVFRKQTGALVQAVLRRQQQTYNTSVPRIWRK